MWKYFSSVKIKLTSETITCVFDLVQKKEEVQKSYDKGVFDKTTIMDKRERQIFWWSNG